MLPTVIEPLREKWDAARAAAFTLNMQGKNAEARAAVHDFLAELCRTTVLDPACGSGNFLYVTMEHMKKLEGEVRDELRQLGETQELLERGGLTVDPHQFLGLEINPRAVAIAELVLWIGYLKWHIRTLGHAPNEPLLRAFNNIKEQDAVLAYDRKEPAIDEAGNQISRWDGHTMKVSPVTGEEIPDESARIPVYRYINPRIAEWPRADYVVGNPPFIGNKYMRVHLGDGYVDTLRTIHHSVPESADYVMYWWEHAAQSAHRYGTKRFGLITTNSITQTYNRKVVAEHIGAGRSLMLKFAIADHPWVDASDGAAVRIAMTVTAHRDSPGRARLLRVARERAGDDEGQERNFDVIEQEVESIHPNLGAGADTTTATSLEANDGLAFQGVTPLGEGFRLDLASLRSLGYRPDNLPTVLRRYVIGRDLARRPEERYVIDFFGLSAEDARHQHPQLFQVLLDRVKPERNQQKRAQYRSRWWVFAEARSLMRPAIFSLDRYIATCQTARHRVFVFLPPETMPDQKIVAIGLSDAYFLGVLSSSLHVLYATRLGSWLGEGNDPCYNPTYCFKTFPFPRPSDHQIARIRNLGDSLDGHRKRQQVIFPRLMITDVYNVIQKLRRNEELTSWDRQVHEQGLVSVLRQIHDDLDAAVADAYGWPADLPEEEILRRLVALNAERAEEEKRGLIRWLRPEFQNPTGRSAGQGTLGIADKPTAGKAKKAEKLPWPKTLAEQAQAVRSALAARPKPATAPELCKQFKSAKAERVAELLATLAALGQARPVGGERFVG